MRLRTKESFDVRWFYIWKDKPFYRLSNQWKLNKVVLSKTLQSIASNYMWCQIDYYMSCTNTANAFVVNEIITLTSLSHLHKPSRVCTKSSRVSSSLAIGIVILRYFSAICRIAVIKSSQTSQANMCCKFLPFENTENCLNQMIWSRTSKKYLQLKIPQKYSVFHFGFRLHAF